MLVWMVKGEQAGRFVAVSPKEGRALIAAGDAQHGNTSATKVRKPEYKTREMVAETSEVEIEADAPPPVLEIEDEPAVEETTPRKRKPRKKQD